MGHCLFVTLAANRNFLGCCNGTLRCAGPQQRQGQCTSWRGRTHAGISIQLGIARQRLIPRREARTRNPACSQTIQQHPENFHAKNAFNKLSLAWFKSPLEAVFIVVKISAVPVTASERGIVRVSGCASMVYSSSPGRVLRSIFRFRVSGFKSMLRRTPPCALLKKTC